MRYRREVRGHGVDLRGLDAGLKCCVFRGGVREAPSPCLSFLNERGKAGGTQCVVVLWGHVLSISKDRASGTTMESGWCSGECRLCEAERTQDVWIADTRGDMRSCHEKIQGVCVHNDAFRCNNPQLNTPTHPSTVLGDGRDPVCPPACICLQSNLDQYSLNLTKSHS